VRTPKLLTDVAHAPYPYINNLTVHMRAESLCDTNLYRQFAGFEKALASCRGIPFTGTPGRAIVTGQPPRRHMAMKHARATLMTSFFCAAAALGGGSTTAAPTPEIVDAPVAPRPPTPGLLDGPIGQRLSEKDRTAAIAAQQDAAPSSTRKTWRGDRRRLWDCYAGSGNRGASGLAVAESKVPK
jgi:hypothetical protein